VHRYYGNEMGGKGLELEAFLFSILRTRYLIKIMCTVTRLINSSVCAETEISECNNCKSDVMYKYAN
jgi:hypothetical protein